MIELKDVREYVKQSGIAENYYIGKLDSKKDKSIGVYQLKTRNEFERAVGEVTNNTVGFKGISILIHWNKNAAETETAAYELYKFLIDTLPNTIIGSHEVCYVEMLQNEPIDVSTDDLGIYERVIEIIIYYKNNF